MVREDFSSIEKTVIQTPATTSDLTVLIGVMGTLEGNVILSLDADSSKKIATTMTGGFEFKEIDEMLKSAIAELGNTIMGRVCMKLSEIGKNVDITPPVVIEGKDVKLSVKVSPLLKITFENISKTLRLSLCIALK